jgi:hypothetical protein
MSRLFNPRVILRCNHRLSCTLTKRWHQRETDFFNRILRIAARRVGQQVSSPVPRRLDQTGRGQADKRITLAFCAKRKQMMLTEPKKKRGISGEEEALTTASVGGYGPSNN